MPRSVAEGGGSQSLLSDTLDRDGDMIFPLVPSGFLATSANSAQTDPRKFEIYTSGVGTDGSTSIPEHGHESPGVPYLVVLQKYMAVYF